MKGISLLILPITIMLDGCGSSDEEKVTQLPELNDIETSLPPGHASCDEFFSILPQWFIPTFIGNA